MKKTVLLILMVCISIPVLINAADPQPARIKAKELKHLMDNNEEFLLIDSRDSGRYGAGHIKGSANIHYDPSGDPNMRNMTLMALPMDKPVIIYGDGEDEETAAAMAMELYDMGCDMDKLKILSGGIAQWKKQGYPLIKAGE